LQCQPTLGARPSCLGPRASSAVPPPEGEARHPMPERWSPPCPPSEDDLAGGSVPVIDRSASPPVERASRGALLRRPKPTGRRPTPFTRSDTLRRRGVTFREWVLLGVLAPNLGHPSTEADFRPGVFHHLVVRSRSPSPPHSPSLRANPSFRVVKRLFDLAREGGNEDLTFAPEARLGFAFPRGEPRCPALPRRSATAASATGSP